MKSRIVFLFIGFCILWGLLVSRAVYLQVLPNNRLKSLQKRQFETLVTLPSRRGDVVDRKGHELAVSTTTYSLFADPKIIEDQQKAARFLAKELGIPLKTIQQKIKNKKKRFVWIQRNLERPQQERIQRAKIRGLDFVEESKRTYPNDGLLANVLGFVGSEANGLEGLEARYDDELRGKKKQVSFQRDARGRPLIVNGQVFTEAPNGADIQLTIDRELQFMLEQEIKTAVEYHQADAASGIILDAQTSEVLAMAMAPSFDPNQPAKFAPDRRRNRAITDAFEAGSVMKTFVIAGALQNGLIEPNTKFDCEGGQLRIGKRLIREAESNSDHAFGIMTVSEILAKSSNVGTTKIAFKLGDKRLREILGNFGFGEKSTIDLPGEVRGIVQPLPWRDHLLSNISFGHGIAVTALQVANAYAAIANGGWLKRPYLVKSIRDSETGEVIETRPKTLRQVLTPVQAAKMRLMLTGVTSAGGTGINARVPGFPVAGKTGTAQKVNPDGRGYLPGGYVSSFAGFIPANDPKFVIYVMVDHPRKEYYGSQTSAPIFSRIAKFAVRNSGLAPVMLSEANLIPQSNAIASALDPSPASAADTSQARAMVAATAAMNGASDSTAGEGPPSNEPLAKTLSLSESERPVPNLTGLSLRETLQRLRGTGIEINVRGSGFVTNTYPPPGAPLPKNKHLTVIFADSVIE